MTREPLSAHPTHAMKGDHCETCSAYVREVSITLPCLYRSAAGPTKGERAAHELAVSVEDELSKLRADLAAMTEKANKLSEYIEAYRAEATDTMGELSAEIGIQKRRAEQAERDRDALKAFVEKLAMPLGDNGNLLKSRGDYAGAWNAAVDHIHTQARDVLARLTADGQQEDK